MNNSNDSPPIDVTCRKSQLEISLKMLLCFVSRCVFPLDPSHPHPPSGISPGVEAERGSAIFTSLISHLSLAPFPHPPPRCEEARMGLTRGLNFARTLAHAYAFNPLSAFDPNL